MSCPSCGSEDVVQKYQGKHLGNYCESCGRWLTWVAQGWKSFTWPVGAKHRGQTLAMIALNDRPYLIWAAENMEGTLQKRAIEALEATSGIKTDIVAPCEKDISTKIEEGFKKELPKLESEGKDSDLPW